MQTALARAMFGGMLVMSTTWLMAVGCSSTNDSPSAPDATPAQCPRSVDEALVALCGADGDECPIGYACGDTPEQAHCTCAGHKYKCVDATGADIVQGTPPACVPVGPANDKECPKTETGTDGLACKTAGLLCNYEGVQGPEATVPRT